MSKRVGYLKQIYYYCRCFSSLMVNRACGENVRTEDSCPTAELLRCLALSILERYMQGITTTKKIKMASL